MKEWNIKQLEMKHATCSLSMTITNDYYKSPFDRVYTNVSCDLLVIQKKVIQ